MSPVGILTVVAVVAFFRRLSSLLCRGFGIGLMLVAAWRFDAGHVDVEGLWLAAFGLTVWFVGQMRFRLHRGRWRSRLLATIADQLGSGSLAQQS